MVMDVSEWDNKRDLIVPMTDQEKQMMMQNSPQVQQAQAQQAQQQQQLQNDMTLEDQKIKWRIAVNAVKQQHEQMVESPLDRASAYTERLSDENQMRQSQFFGAPTSSGGGGL